MTVASLGAEQQQIRANAPSPGRSGALKESAPPLPYPPPSKSRDTQSRLFDEGL